VTGAALLDTDVLSALMRGTPVVVANAGAYLAEHGRFCFSVITRYEILRGLKAKGASAQIARLPGSAPPVTSSR
jgi:tRNA(fMet)-specific endonuclease VapC